jgi:hypothetical protein
VTWLGLRLTLGGGRRGLTALVLTTLVVAVGATLLLLALSVAPALQSRANRTAWMNPATDGPGGPARRGPYTLVGSTQDRFGDARITLVDVAGVGGRPPTPPGVSALPRQGHVMVSAGLRRLIAAESELRVRYGTVDGTLPARVVDGPDALIALRGVSATDAALTGTAVTSFPTTGRVLELTGIVRLLLLFGAVAMLAPLVILVSMATRLTATTREQRLAALRLAGATTGQTARLTLVESTLVGLLGLALGAALFVLVRPAAAYVTYDGQRWFVRDIAPGVAGWAVAAVAVPLAAVLAASRTLARVAVNPLEVARRSRPQIPGWWRLAPLLLAIPLLRLAITDGTVSGGGHGRTVVTGFALLLGTLLLAGPAVTRAIGLLLARASRPAALLAGRRLTDDPKASFRPVSAAAVAVLAVTMFAAATPAAAESLSVTPVTGQPSGTAAASVYFASRPRSAALLHDILGIRGVSAAALVYQGTVQTGGQSVLAWIGDCHQMVAASRLRSIPCGDGPLLSGVGKAVVSRGRLEVDSLGSRYVVGVTQPLPEKAITSVFVPASRLAVMPRLTGVDVPNVVIDSRLVPPSTLGQLRPTLLLAAYEGGPTALERLRTSVVRSIPQGAVATRQTTFEGYSSDVRTLYRVVAVGAVGVAAMASLALLVAVAVGLLERRRPLSFLLASGTPMAVLRRSVLLEAEAPLIVLVVLAAALGTLVGHWSVTATTTSTELPGRGLLAPPAAALLVGTVLASAAMLLVRTVTQGEQTRFD